MAATLLNHLTLHTSIRFIHYGEGDFRAGEDFGNSILIYKFAETIIYLWLII